MKRHDVRATLAWMQAGTTRLLAAADTLTDPQLTEPSLLPDWKRVHVLAHLSRNADALGRLASWARTGVETPMYAGVEQRNAEIAATAGLAPADLRTDLRLTADRLDRALAALTPAQWSAPVRTAQGRTVPAAELPWMRVREVWLHAVDLDAGVGIDDLPADVVDLLLDDVTGTLTGRDGCPALQLLPHDRLRTWYLGAGPVSPPGSYFGPRFEDVTVSGTAAGVLAWLTGRSTGDGLTGPRPALPRWL